MKRPNEIRKDVKDYLRKILERERETYSKQVERLKIRNRYADQEALDWGLTLVQEVERLLPHLAEPFILPTKDSRPALTLEEAEAILGQCHREAWRPSKKDGITEWWLGKPGTARIVATGRFRSDTYEYEVAFSPNATSGKTTYTVFCKEEAKLLYAFHKTQRTHAVF